jgi:tRNA dimethylallyltransferase
MQKQKLIVICGQTATGKSDFAVQIAKKFNGEIISADSRQVYTGLNIGTGKITKKEMSGVPHHLLDVVSPKKVFSAGDFKKLATRSIKDINTRGKTPIICGGTGFYIDALLGIIDLPEVPPNKELRKKLGSKTKTQLLTMLKKLDPVRAETIDQDNPVRLIRAIEIAQALGKVPTLKTESIYDVLWIGLDLPDEILKEKIRMRLFVRMGKYKMLSEARELHKQGLSWKRMQELGLEYRYMALHLTGKISKEEMLSQLETAIWHYAKRQKTWFKRNKEINWIDPRKKSQKIKIEKITKIFLTS